MVDYALIIGLVAICAISTLSHIGDLSNNSFTLLSHTFQEAQRNYEEQMLSLQNNRTIKEYADVAAGTASADIAQSWAGSTVYGQDNIGSPPDDSNPNSGNIVDGSGENINHPPVAKFSFYNDIKPALGKKFQLLNISTDEDGDRIAKAEWSGVPSESMFKSAGIFTIKLRVADEHGLWSDWYSETFTVENQIPVAIITKDTEFSVLDEADQDLAVDGYGYYLMGEHNKTLNLYETSSYDPDGHNLVYAHWVSNINGIENVIDSNFGDGLTISQTKSGPVRVSLFVEDEYEGKSEVVDTAFYYFASKRPEIRNITFSDGSNGLPKLETLTGNEWITEIYPYVGNSELQIPVSSNDTRISFKVEDDSNAITHYQYKFNGALSPFIALDSLNKEDLMFDLADLMNDFSTKNGSAILNFRVCDDSETCSRWTEDIPVVFKSISDVHPLIKNFTIENYSTYDEAPIPDAGNNNYITGTFRGTIELDDIYGNMRTLDSLYLYLNNSTLEYENLTKISGTKYTFWFTINEEMTNANMTVKGVYDTHDETDRAEIESFNVSKYAISILNAEMTNKDIPNWWSVNLMELGDENTNKISPIKSDGTDGFYNINITLSSVYNAPITNAILTTADSDGSNVMTTTINGWQVESVSNQTVNIILPATDYNQYFLSDTYKLVHFAIIDEMGNISNPTLDTGTKIKLIDYATYTPILQSYVIKDAEGTEGQSDKIYSRGVVTVDYKVEDFFYTIRGLDKTQGLEMELLGSINGLVISQSEVTTTNRDQIIEQTFTIDNHDWDYWQEMFDPTLGAEISYLSYYIHNLDINYKNYTPHTIIGLEYKPHKKGGQYLIHIRPSIYKEYFDINTVVLEIQLDSGMVTKTINFEDAVYTPVTDTDHIVTVISDRLPSRATTVVSAYLTHTNDIINSNKFTNSITVDKPYDIEIVKMDTNRAPSTTTNGFTKMFDDLDIVDSTISNDMFENIPLEESTTNRNHKVNIRMSAYTKSDLVAPIEYATYDNLAITPTGSIIFSNLYVGEDNNYYINTSASENNVTSVSDDTYGNDMFTIFSGDIIFDNTPGSGSGIYYKKNIHYLDSLEEKSATSTTIKYINICSATDWDSISKICANPFSIEATIYDNGSVRVHYGNVPETIINSSILAGRINVETNNDIYFATAYGQYTGTESFANKTFRFNKLPDYYKIPPTITDIIYEQSDSTTKPTIDATTSETILAKYTILFDNPDNVSILLHEGSLTQYQYNNLTGETTETSAQITKDGSAVSSGTKYVFESPTVIKRVSSRAKIKLRLKYDNAPYYSAWFEKDNYTYVGPIIINFTASVPTHVEPTKSISGYTSIDFTSGNSGNCDAWSANSSNYYDDCSSELIPLGFEMAYINGERVSNFSVSTNSLIRFDKVVQTGFTAKPVTGLEDDTLAVLWYDQDFQGTSTSSTNPKGIFYKRFLTATVPYVSIKYLGMTAYSGGSQPWNYEVQIYQDGKIIVHYSKEVPVKMKQDSNNEYTIPYTTVAFKKTMLMGYGSLVIPSSGELDSQMDFVSTRKLKGSVTSSSSYVGQSSTGKSIQINLNQCNLGEDNCAEYTAPVKNNNETVYSCTKATETVNLSAGTYKIQAWGAQGGSTSSQTGGKGGYAEGTIRLTSATNVYVNVGCQTETMAGGFNGGGSAHYSSYRGGGGASDIRIGGNDIAYRVIVAGGGGGAASTPGGAGGGMEGLTNGLENDGLGGSINNIYRTNSSTLAFPGSFGFGGNQISASSSTSGGAGGGGYFGGNAGTNKGSGGGGSGYVYESNSIQNPTILSGTQAIPTVDHSGTKIGQNGNGYIIITKLTNNTSIPAFNVNNFTTEMNNLKTLYPRFDNFNVGEKRTYSHSTTTRNIKLDPGTYKLEVWGANGGASSSSYYGKGGYSTGLLTLAETVDAYIHTGGSGSYSTSGGSAGGHNGGGQTTVAKAGSGGGATDIRLFQDLLANRVIVAGGGGGAFNTTKGGAGGGLEGLTGSGTQTPGTGGTQEFGGITLDYYESCVQPGTFGIGGTSACSTSDATSAAGGGGGYYGGGAGINEHAGGGGSGYINENLKEARTVAGNASMPSTSGGTETGHSGSGYVIITKINNETAYPITLDTFADFKIGDVRDYTTENGYQTETVLLDPGIYRIQTWGAQGGAPSGQQGGKGGYAEATISINAKTEAYVTVGGAGSYATNASSPGGFNGGGAGSSYAGSGGGASDVRIGGNALSNRIIVAGGGGGSSVRGTSIGIGGAGGGVNGENGSSTYSNDYIGLGGTQTAENSTTLGNGTGNTYVGSTNNRVGAGGGGGYYGGTAGSGNAAGGGGGSSYIAPSTLTGFTISGNTAMPSSTSIDGSQEGQTGDGHVRITRINQADILSAGTQKTYNQLATTYIETLEPGTYELSLWGASGGNGNNTNKGGAGGYTTGLYTVTTPTQIFITTGGAGTNANPSGISAGGYNGGGSGSRGAGSGGGASDIRANGINLNNRIIVAAGGGGGAFYSASYSGSGGSAGGQAGLNGTSVAVNYFGTGGTQTAGGTASAVNSTNYYKPGTFGFGGNATSTSSGRNNCAGGGGAGYYGGSSGGGNCGGGGGGSSYFDTSKITSGLTLDGTMVQPSPTSSSSQTGHIGNGYIKIYRLN